MTLFWHKVFENILNRHIEWPEEEESLSQAAVETILALLQTEPASRADGVKVKAMELTKEVSWSFFNGTSLLIVALNRLIGNILANKKRPLCQCLTTRRIPLTSTRGTSCKASLYQRLTYDL